MRQSRTPGDSRFIQRPQVKSCVFPLSLPLLSRQGLALPARAATAPATAETESQPGHREQLGKVLLNQPTGRAWGRGAVPSPPTVTTAVPGGCVSAGYRSPKGCAIKQTHFIFLASGYSGKRARGGGGTGRTSTRGASRRVVPAGAHGCSPGSAGLRSGGAWAGLGPARAAAPRGNLFRAAGAGCRCSRERRGRAAGGARRGAAPLRRAAAARGAHVEVLHALLSSAPIGPRRGDIL